MKKILTIALALLCAGAFMFAEEDENLKFSLTVQAAYYPDNENLTTASAVPLVSPLDNGAEANHYSPIIGPFSGLEGRITPQVDYIIPTPLGDNWLVSGANVKLSGYLQITPVSLNLGGIAAFTPLPFLVFAAGGECGTGWELGSFKTGLGLYDDDPLSETYNTYKTMAFSSYNLKTWFQGTFQFDFGAIFPGDWTHVVMMYTYQAYYKKNTAAADQQLWMWNLAGNQVNGWYQYMNGVLAYQFPAVDVLSMAGVMFESDGAYSDDVYANADYKGSFKEMSLEPFVALDLSKNDSLTFLFHWCSRRTFLTRPDKNDEKNLTIPDAYYTTVGREWYFKRFAINYVHRF